MSASFIRDESLLEENARVDDLLDVTETVDYYEKRIMSIERSGVLAILGPFGVGKSTVLYQVEKRLRGKENPQEEEKEGGAERQGVTWINFDAWKYPERKDMWEGFVLDFAEQIGNRSKIRRRIEGKSVASQAVKALPGAVVGGLTNVPFVQGLCERFMNMPTLQGVAEKLANVFTPSPATRVFEIQRILEEMISAQRRRIVVVVEDVDRSGPPGVYFLETLRQFMHGLRSDTKLVVVAPMSDEEYDQGHASFEKCVDYVDRFRLRSPKLDGFVDAVFDPSRFSANGTRVVNGVGFGGPFARGQISSFLRALLATSPNATMRTIKCILRNADKAFALQTEAGLEPHFVVTIGFEAAKHCSLEGKDHDFDPNQIRRLGHVPRGSLLGALLYAIARNSATVFETDDPAAKPVIHWSPNDFKLAPRTDLRSQPSIPFTYRRPPRDRDDLDTEGVAICDFYLDY